MIKETRETQVAMQMDNLKDKLSELEKSITDLPRCLSSVLKSDTPDDGIKPIAVQKALVPLADDIRSAANRISSMNVEVAVLFTRLEL